MAMKGDSDRGIIVCKRCGEREAHYRISRQGNGCYVMKVWSFVAPLYCRDCGNDAANERAALTDSIGEGK